MKAKLMLCIGMLLAATGLFAQHDITVTGVVMEQATGLPAIGVSVLLKGTTTGTVTGIDGDYTLKDIPSDGTLVFSYVGMKTVEEPVNGRTVINVTMYDDTQALDEVVVIGYGTSKAKDLTAPIAVVKADEIVKHATASPMQALQGKVPGLQIVNSGQPGKGPDVRIRGVGSFKDTQPLYVVDGMFYDNIDFLNNADIDDISILKDASAASIYGVRAANGVVIVTTKRGLYNKKATITYDGYVGFQKATNILKMASSQQYAEMIKGIGSPTGLSVLENSIERYGGDAATHTPGMNTDWYKELLRTALIHNHSLDVTGGSDKTTYSVGLSYLFQEGIMKSKNEYERLNMRAKADYNAFSWLKIGANIVLTNASQYLPDNGAWGRAYQTPGLIPVIDENQTAEQSFPVKYASPALIGLSDYFGNPVANAKYHDERNQTVQILPTFYAELNLMPESKLVFRTAYSQDISFLRGYNYTPQYRVGGSQLADVSSLYKDTKFYRNWIVDNTLTYRDQFGKHGLTALLGQSTRTDNYRYLWGRAPGVPGGKEEYMYLSQGNAAGRETGDDGTTYRGLSFFGRVMYDYADKYLLSVTMRADGSSKYQEKWGYFPSVGAGWILTQEDFMKDQKAVDFLKLRASWGKLGNDKVQASDGFASITQDQNTSGVFGQSLLPGYTNVVYFSWLDWEVVNEFNIGADMSFLQNRLSFEFDYYRRITENAVIERPLPMGAGNLLGNNGKIQNSGIELSLSWSDVIGDAFSYNVGFNLTTLKNKIKNLNGLPYIYGNTAEFRTISRVGDSLNAFYGYELEGVYQTPEEVNADPVAVNYNAKQQTDATKIVPGDFKYKDQNGDGIIDAADRTILGSYLPDVTYGINAGFSYKNFDFSIVMQGQAGNEILNRKRGDRLWQSDINYDADMVEHRWTGPGSTNKYPSAAGSVKTWNIARFNSFYIEDGSYFRIQNIQLAYTFDSFKLRAFDFPSVRLSFSAERPFTHFHTNGFTPEVANGIDTQVYPMAATYTFGLRIIY